MSQPVKRRRYDSPRRREQAAATRRDILDAARRLFEQNGYAATTMADIASGAGVALKTVYLSFETKSGVLRALWNLLLRGDEADSPMGEREWYRAVLAEPDAGRQLDLTARASRIVKTRLGAMFIVVRDAGASDPDAAALWGRIGSEFHANQRAIVASIARKGALKPRLGVDRAADTLWTLNHPDVWRLLVLERGWSPARWERWFAGAARAELLAVP
jgi:AcrR family transcriptional regulator